MGATEQNLHENKELKMQSFYRTVARRAHTKFVPIASLALVTLSFFVTENATARDGPFVDGRWEIKRERKGGPGGNATVTQTACFTKPQLASDPAAIFKTPPPAQEKDRAPPACTFIDVTLVQGRVSYVATCSTPMGQMRVPTHGTYTATTFSVASQARMGVMQMTMTMSGRHLGACNG